MAHLRTSFIQTCNNTSSVFSSWSGLAASIGSLFNNDDKEDTRNINSQENAVKTNAYRSLMLFPGKQMFLSEQQRSVHSLINLNINSLSELMDNESGDFPKDQNFVHVLQIQTEQEKQTEQQKYLRSLQTLQSMNIQDNPHHNFSPNSTQIGSQLVHNDLESEYSDVEPIQL